MLRTGHAWTWDLRSAGHSVVGGGSWRRSRRRSGTLVAAQVIDGENIRSHRCPATCLSLRATCYACERLRATREPTVDRLVSPSLVRGRIEDRSGSHIAGLFACVALDRQRNEQQLSVPVLFTRTRTRTTQEHDTVPFPVMRSPHSANGCSESLQTHHIELSRSSEKWNPCT